MKFAEEVILKVAVAYLSAGTVVAARVTRAGISVEAVREEVRPDSGARHEEVGHDS
jgi:hypothetical protein